MGDASVRAAIVSYFNTTTNLAASNIEKWYQDEPWFLQGQDWNLRANGGWGCIGYVHLDTASETRRAFGGVDVTGAPQGSKMILHTVSLVGMYQFLIPTNKTNVTDAADRWVGPLDAMIDATKNAIRIDPTLGTAAQGNARAIWQAGQGYNGAPDIRQTRDLPVQDPQRGRVISWWRLEFDALEIIQG